MWNQLAHCCWRRMRAIAAVYKFRVCTGGAIGRQHARCFCKVTNGVGLCGCGSVHLLMTMISGPSVSIHVPHSVRVSLEAALRLSRPFWCMSYENKPNGLGCAVVTVPERLYVAGRLMLAIWAASSLLNVSNTYHISKTEVETRHLQ